MAEVAFYNNTPNFLGTLFEINRRKTQFLSLIGGAEGQNAMITSTPEFPISVNYDIGEASQPEISEVDAMKGATPSVVGKQQNTNVIQIFQEAVMITHFRQRATGTLSGLNIAGQLPEASNEEAFQIMAKLEKMKEDMNYTAINGVYKDEGLTSEAGAMGTRGILAAVQTNKVVGELTPDNITELHRLVWSNGKLDNPVLFASSKNRVAISKAFKVEGLTEVERERTVGGVAVGKIVTDFGELFLATDDMFPDDKVALVDIEHVQPVFTKNDKTGEIISVIPHDQHGGRSYEIYAEFGLNHGDERLHGVLEVSSPGE